MIVRFTNRDIICQIASAKIEGDHILAAAYAHELPAYGLPAKLGLTNYAAAYATGLLLARRALTKLDLQNIYTGADTIDGEDYHVVKSAAAEKQQELKDEGEGGKRPFRVVLDIGLVRTTTGGKVFGALKGACDGGLDIPHKTSRFPGAKGKDDYDPAAHRAYIFGGPVADYMRHLQEEDPDRYKKHFSRFIAAGVKPEGLEGMYSKVHAKIRESPAYTKKAKRPPAKGRIKRARLSAPQKRANAIKKLDNMARRAAE